MRLSSYFLPFFLLVSRQAITFSHMDRFGERLRKLREDNQLSQAQLGEIIGIGAKHVSALERGTGMPSYQVLYRLAQEFHADMNRFFRDGHGRGVGNGEDSVSLLPIISQRAAAGHGVSLIEDAEIIGQLPVLDRLIASYPREKLKVVEVRGDSMTGINLFDGDYAVFVQGLVRDSGIYVLTLDGAVLIKRIEYDRVSRKVLIYSENPRYQGPKEIQDDSDLLKIEGKVVAWFHNHPY